MGGGVDFGAIRERTAAELGDAYQNLVGFAIGGAQALVVAGVAILVGRGLRRRVRRSLARTPLDRNLTALLANGMAIATYAVAGSFGLALLGADWTAVGAILGAGTVALGLALQDVLRNFVAGLYVLLERPFAIGDRIKVRDVDGTVEAIDLRTTVIRSERGERVLVPNATVFAEVLTNRSAAGRSWTVVTVTGVAGPVAGVPDAVRGALAGLDVNGRGERSPEMEVELLGVAGGGAEVRVRVAHERGVEPAAAVAARLRERFPDAGLAIERG